jgi:hypothetical protein
MVLAVAVKQVLLFAVIIIVAPVSAVMANNVTIPVRGTVVIAELGVSVLTGKPAAKDYVAIPVKNVAPLFLVRHSLLVLFLVKQRMVRVVLD